MYCDDLKPFINMNVREFRAVTPYVWLSTLLRVATNLEVEFGSVQAVIMSCERSSLMREGGWRRWLLAISFLNLVVAK